MQQEEVVQLYLDDIIPNRFQPREVFDERLLKELAVSIKEHGVIQPIIVRKVNDKYEIIAGERRYKASALAGLTKIPAIVRDLDDKESSKVALLENLQRKNLNPLEEARTYQKILELDEMTQENLAKTMGKSQSAVANKIRLLSLPEEIQSAILNEEISERHARTLLNVSDKEEQLKLLNEIISNKMTVRQLEERIKGDNSKPMEESNDIQVEQPEETGQIGNEAFVPTKPLMPSFTLTEEDEEEPLIISGGNEETSEEDNNSGGEPLIINQQETESSEEEPLIVNQADTNDEISDSPQEEPLIINNEDSNQTEESSQNESVADSQQIDPSNFINFGEIDDEDDEDDLYSDSIPQGNTNPIIDIPNNEDIQDKNAEGINLDSLLNIGKPSSQVPMVSNESYSASPVEQALKESEEEESESEEYFKAPDLLNVTIPNQEEATIPNNVPLSDASTAVNSSSEGNLESAVNEIKKAVANIEAMGIKVDKDELNLSNSYQIVIKLEK